MLCIQELLPLNWRVRHGLLDVADEESNKRTVIIESTVETLSGSFFGSDI